MRRTILLTTPDCLNHEPLARKIHKDGVSKFLAAARGGFALVPASGISALASARRIGFLGLLRGLAGREAFGAATELLAVVGRIGRGI